MEERGKVSFEGLQSTQGSFVVESALSLVAVTAFFTALSLALYVVFAKVTIDHFGYHALLCIAQGQSRSLCKSRALGKIKQTLPFGEVRRFELEQNGRHYRIRLTWSLSSRAGLSHVLRTLSFQKTLRYPRGF